MTILDSGKSYIMKMLNLLLEDTIIDIQIGNNKELYISGDKEWNYIIIKFESGVELITSLYPNNDYGYTIIYSPFAIDELRFSTYAVHDQTLFVGFRPCSSEIKVTNELIKESNILSLKFVWTRIEDTIKQSFDDNWYNKIINSDSIKIFWRSICDGTCKEFIAPIDI